MTDLYIIRHAKYDDSDPPRIADMKGDFGLTTKGVRQAELLRDRLGAANEIKADVLIASPFPRARQTAEIIQPVLGVPILFDTEMQELSSGEADGLTLTEADEKYGTWSPFDDPFLPPAPGGESWAQFSLRISGALNRITREYAGKTIVIVTHGGVVQAAFTYFMQMSSFTAPSVAFNSAYTAITHWHYRQRENRPSRWGLESYNDSNHLRDFDM